FPLNRSEKKTYNKQYLSIVFIRKESSEGFRYVFANNLLTDLNSISFKAKDMLITFPVYRNIDRDTEQSFNHSRFQNPIGMEKSRVPNLNSQIVKQIAEKLGLSFIHE